MKIYKFVNAVAAAVLCATSSAYAHGAGPGHIDEGPSPPTWITIVMVVAWIVIALGVVFFILRLIRMNGSKELNKADRPKGEMTDMKATQQLKDEHEGIKMMLSILEQVSRQLEATGKLNKEHFDGILEFLKVFVDKCHHAKEEELLFPALVVAGVPKDGPVSVMLHEHEAGRNYIKAMNAAFAEYVAGDMSLSKNIIQNIHGYSSLLREHIEKENNVLFVMADNLLSEKKQDELLEGFEKIEEERIGVGKHEEFHGLINKLSRIYLS